MNTTMTTLAFQGIAFDPVRHDSQIWLKMSEIERALGYVRLGKALAQIYTSHADEFTSSMTRMMKLATAGGKQMIRVFSLRGAHLLAMFARTEVAKAFRVWVLNVLDAEVARGRAPQAPGLDATLREVLEKVIADAEFIRSWWNAYGPPLEQLNPHLAGQVSEHIVSAAVGGRTLVRALSLKSLQKYAAGYPWRGGVAARRAYGANLPEVAP